MFVTVVSVDAKAFRKPVQMHMYRAVLLSQCGQTQ